MHTMNIIEQAKKIFCPHGTYILVKQEKTNKCVCVKDREMIMT